MKLLFNNMKNIFIQVILVKILKKVLSLYKKALQAFASQINFDEWQFNFLILTKE